MIGKNTKERRKRPEDESPRPSVRTGAPPLKEDEKRLKGALTAITSFRDVRMLSAGLVSGPALWYTRTQQNGRGEYVAIEIC